MDYVDKYKYSVTQFWDRFDILAGHVNRYSLPEDSILEEALENHGADKMFALVDKICIDIETGEDTIHNPSGLMVSTIRGKIKFPPVFKERQGSSSGEDPNWYRQSLEDIRQYKYYIVYDSNDIKQKDLTHEEILSLGRGLNNISSPIIDTFWTVYGCLKMLRVPSMIGPYPIPELSVCRSFDMFNELGSFFRGRVTPTEEQKKRIAEYIKKHQDARAEFESRQPGLIRLSADLIVESDE